MSHNVKQKNSKKMGLEAVRWHVLTIAFLSIFIAVFCMTGKAAAANYFLNITSPTNGTVEFGPPLLACDPFCIGVFDETQSVNLAAVPDPGYEFVNWTGTGASDFGDPTSSTQNFTMGAADRTVTANFQKVTYSLTTTQVGNGTVTPSTTYVYDDGLAIVATPDPGWEFVNWTGDTANLVANAASTNLVAPLMANTAIQANFQKINYTLTISVSAGNGTVAPASGTTYVYDDGLAIVATPDPGWEFVNWTGDTANLVANAASTNLVAPLMANTAIQANFQKINYTLTISVSAGNGTVAPASGTTYVYDDGLAIVATPDPGWEFVNWTGDTANLVANAASTNLVAPLMANTAIQANFQKINYTLTISVGAGNGTVAPASGTTYVYDDGLAIVATPDPGWEFVNWTGDTANLVANAASTNLVAPLMANTAIQANFQKINYTLTISVSAGNGTVAPASGTTYVYDDGLAIVATPDPGWEFVNWTGDTANLVANAASTNLVAPLMANTAIQANFQKINYTLTISVSAGNGTVAPASGTTYVYDDGLAIVATPDPGWEFVNWTGDTANLVANAASTNLVAPLMANTAIQANFQKINYTLTISVGAGNGTVAPASGTTYVYDDGLAIVATPDPGWEFVNWTGDTANLVANAASTNLVAPLMANTAIQANFQKINYTLTISVSAGNGTVAPASGTTYVYDDGLAIVATPDPGWEFVNWTGDTANLVANAASTNLVAPLMANTAIQANFQKINYTLTISVSAGNGTVAPASGTTYVYDDGLAIVATPDPGWEFVNWTGDTANLVANAASTNLVAPLMANTAIQANFQKINYTLTISVGAGNGTVAPASGTTYVYDDGLAIVATPDPGWEFVNWTGDTANLVANAASTNLVAPLMANTAIQANFQKINYTLTISVGAGNGTVAPASGTTYVYDDGLAIVATPDPGWEFVNWTGDTANLVANAASTNLVAPLMANTAIQANFQKINYTLTISVSAGNGTVAPASGTTYVYDDGLAIVATPDPGWEFVNWTGDTANLVANAASTNLVAPLMANTAIQANFQKINYTLTISVSAGNGTVAPASGTTYVYDDGLAIVATPDPGWEFVNWTGDTANLVANAASTNLVAPLMANTAIQANFQKINYTLTISVGAGNGTVAPASGTTYVYDDGLAIVATPDPGWEFVNWTGDTANLVTPGAASTNLVNPLTVDTTLQANFQKITYSLTTTQVGNGTVTPSTTYVYDQGLAVAAVPDPGWEFVNWTGDTANLIDANAASTTIINPIFGDTTITANFQKITYTLTISVGAGNGTVAPVTGTTYVYDQGLAVSASPAAGKFFVNWSGDTANLVDPGSANTTLVNPLTADTTIQANFDYIEYTLTVNTTGTGSVIKAPDQGSYHYGDIIALTAIPDDEGWLFKEWIGDVAEPLLANTTIMIDGDKTITAVFEETTYTLHLAVSGEGTVTPSAGTHAYSDGQVVTLNAVPLSGDWVFDHWSGDVADSSNPSTTVTMYGDQTITAFFITSLDPDVDHDGDGYAPNDGDCNDSDSAVYPGAPETCGDGIDQDCNGLDTSCDIDNDGDGYWANDILSPDYDCDDNDRSVYPGATEICEDGIDQDCDGFDLSCDPNDIDGDGDGFTVNMGDCDDADLAIHPGATEICDSLVDEDCYDGDRPCGSEALCVDISDTPLDTQISAASASIMFLLDDSGSMDWEFTTNQPDGLFDGQYYPFDNPGDNAYSGHILTNDQRTQWTSQWSGYNKMYYDPASTYTPWPNHLGAGNLPDADPNNPRSNPLNAANTFNLDGVYLTLNEEGPHVTVTRENSGSSTCADAVRFRRVSDSLEFIIDNSQPGFSTTGRWRSSSGQPGYDPAIPGAHWASGYSLYSDRNGSVATWRKALPSVGQYEVYAWWTDAGDRADDAPYEIFDGNHSEAVVDVNQDNNGGQWNSLGIFTFNNITPSSRDIIRAHYYKWHDADGDTNVDDGEVYLIELKGGAINYYRFNDNNGNDKLDPGELTDVTGSQPSEIVPKNLNGTDRTYAQERQNFANWYSFYRKRELAAKAAVGKVIDGMNGVQIGILTIHNRIAQTVLPVKVSQGGVILDQSDTLLGLLYGLNSGGNTPLRRALQNIGEYFDADDGKTGGLGNSPYAASAGGACQQAFTIAMTDGYYNGDEPANDASFDAVGNTDGDNNTDFDGLPYGDTASNTLADIAMHYYERDLSSSLDDQVPRGGGDTARHQHMVTYTVSFGVFGSIDPASWPNCPNTCPDPWPGTGNNQGKIDDMYHAAVNGRGEYLSAENPQNLVDALNALKTSIEKRIGSGASVAINSQQLSSGSVLFQGIYDTNAWSGDIQAYQLDPITGELPPTYTWSAHEQLELMDWDTSREIITFNGTDGVEFRHSGINPIPATQLALIDADSAKAAAIVDFLRGDDTNEQGRGGTYSFRSRTSKLGDIVHSSPLLAGNVLYVGSNSGMLHAFDIPTGNEIFAYVPRLIFENLDKLTVENPNYAHTYYVDQPPYLANVGGDDLLVGTLGKGGKGVYCLNVSTITNAESNADIIVKWEYPNSTDPDNSPDADLGYGFSRAFIVDSYAGPVVIFSNGYQSTNNRAVFYVLNPANGSVLRKIDTGVGDAANCNGLSTPVLIDIDLDKKVDFAYAGDLLGNMWKFDLRDSNVNNWTSAFESGGSYQPLFQAKNAQGQRQPITMKPDVMRHCAYGRYGYMVLFGTGRYLGNADFADVSVQTLYGIWDWQEAWQNETAGSHSDKYLGSFTASRKLSNLDGNASLPANAQNVTLLEQTQIFFGSAGGAPFRVLSDNQPDWYSMADDSGSHAGWYFDLPATNERAFKDVMIWGGVNIAISSLPSDSPCASGGNSILHALDACTGARLQQPYYDINGDGSLDSGDLINIGSSEKPIWVAPAGWLKSGMYYPPAILGLNKELARSYFSTSDGNVDTTINRNQPRGLVDWREIE